MKEHEPESVLVRSILVQYIIQIWLKVRTANLQTPWATPLSIRQLKNLINTRVRLAIGIQKEIQVHVKNTHYQFSFLASSPTGATVSNMFFNE